MASDDEVLAGFAKSQARVVEHMNGDHSSSLLAYVHFFAERPEVTSASLVSFDAREMVIIVLGEDGKSEEIRIAYTGEPLKEAKEAHYRLVTLSCYSCK
jgi:putative heme iron utilization protein